MPDRGLPYTPFYCEENAWHIARLDAMHTLDPHVVWVTNASRQCALWSQRAAVGPLAPVVWDYHVFVVARDAEGARSWLVWDPDTTLGCPVSIDLYLERTFSEVLPSALAPRFRVVDGETYVATLSSDRRHMMNTKGEWHSPAPPWPMIQRPGIASNLEDFLALDKAFVGEVMDLRGLRARFG